MKHVHGQRWAHVTYASFKSTTRRSGWNIGPSLHATEQESQEISALAPTNMVPVKSFDDFISSSEIDALPRRFEFKPFPSSAVFMHSVPAGKDSTGRPGNVFTHAAIDRYPEEPMSVNYPIDLYRSPDFLTPFRANAVNAVELRADLQEPDAGPMADLGLAWMMVDDMFGARREAFYQLQDALEARAARVILLLNNTNEAAYWIQALSSTLTPEEARFLLHFSTFERAATLPPFDPTARSSSLMVCPLEDAELLKDLPDVQVIDPARTDVREHGHWARMTAGIFNGNFNAEELVDELLQVNSDLSDFAVRNARLGDGLARLIKNRGDAVSQELFDVADEYLPGAIKEMDVHSSSLRTVKEVIAHPRMAMQRDIWPEVNDPQLRDSALETLETMADAPVRELMSYLNFLLETGFVEEHDALSYRFLDRIAPFPSLASWEKAEPLSNQHPMLRGVLKAAAKSAQQQSYAAASAAPATPTATDIAQAQRIKRQIHKLTPLRTVYQWFEQPQNVEALSLLNQTFPAMEADPYDAPSMIRIYFSVMLPVQLGVPLCAEPARDRDIMRELKELIYKAISRHFEQEIARLGDVDPTQFEQLGRELVDRDYPKLIDHIDPRQFEQELSYLSSQRVDHTDPTMEALTLTARGMLDSIHSLRARQQERRGRFS